MRTCTLPTVGMHLETEPLDENTARLALDHILSHQTLSTGRRPAMLTFLTHKAVILF